MTNKRAKLQQQLREVQGQTDATEVCGKQYVYRKLVRRQAQTTLKSLVGPFIRAAASTIEAVSMPLSDILAGKVDVDFTKLDIAKAAGALDALSEDDYWRLACRILDNVEIDGELYGRLDDSDYYNDKNWEFVQAIFLGIQVNYPFVGDLFQKRGAGSSDSSQDREPE